MLRSLSLTLLLYAYTIQAAVHRVDVVHQLSCAQQ